MKIRRQHHKKHYRYSTNRKSLNKTRKSTGNIKDPVLNKLWDENKRPGKNFSQMGLAGDPNKVVPIPNYKKSRLEVVKLANGFIEEEMTEEEIRNLKKPRAKDFVVKQLAADAKEAAEKKYRLPKGVVSHLSYFLDKYQLNYKAMVTDRKNHDQWTWKQFRMKIRRFMSIPEQFNKYLEKKNLSPDEKLPWPEYDSDSEWR